MNLIIISEVVSGMPIAQEDLAQYGVFAEEIKSQIALKAPEFLITISGKTEDAEKIIQKQEDACGAIFISRAMKRQAQKIAHNFPGVKVIIFSGLEEDFPHKPDNMLSLYKGGNDYLGRLIAFLKK
jgi:hypothetical protein